MMQMNKKGELFDAFADELLAERHPRPLVIVGASKVDHLLAEILVSFLLPKIAKEKQPDELLDGDTPLSTLSARIKICRRLGLIDSSLYSALEVLRKIRNYSAHSVSFDHSKSPVREHIGELKKKLVERRSFKLTKQTYFNDETLSPDEELQCLLLTLCVLLEAIREKTKPTLGSKKAQAIARK